MWVEPVVAILLARHSQINENGQKGGMWVELVVKTTPATAAAIHLSLKWAETASSGQSMSYSFSPFHVGFTRGSGEVAAWFKYAKCEQIKENVIILFLLCVIYNQAVDWSNYAG